MVAVFAIMLATSSAGSDPPRKAPVYLGMSHYPEPVKLGGNAYTLPEQATELRSSIWPSRPGFNFTPNPSYALARDSLNISEYHVPTIVDFLKEGFSPEGINYSYHAPALGDFASPDWSPTSDIHIYHVPAITNFLKNDWQPPQPEFQYYPTWIYQYLRSG